MLTNDTLFSTKKQHRVGDEASLSSALLYFFIFVKSLIAIGLIRYAGIGLGPDEAQYWTWSQHLDWGYYSKPPGIAWQIALGSFFGGDTETGVRWLSVVLSGLTALGVYWLARGAIEERRVAFWASLLFLFSPLGWLSSFLAITDGGFLLFWTWASALFLHRKEKKEIAYLMIGSLIGCGALFKWPIYLLWLFLLPGPGRVSKKIGGVTLSLLGIVPSLYWNAQYDWPTFRHVGSTMRKGAYEQGTNLSLFHGNFWDFIAAQVALFSPLLFLFFCMALWIAWRERTHLSGGLRWVIRVTLLSFGGMALLALGKKMQGNWVVFAYPTAFVLTAWGLCAWKRIGSVSLGVGTVTSSLLCFGVFLLPTAQERGWLALWPIPFHNNPFKHNVGWEGLASLVSEERGELYADTYQLTSLLRFYGPRDEKVHFFNLRGFRKNQFSYAPLPKEGSAGWFVVVENEPHCGKLVEKRAWYREELQHYFEEVEDRGIHPLFWSYGKPVKEALLFRCRGYNGREPAASVTY